MGDFKPGVARVGLNLDATTSQIQQGELSYALNAITSGFNGEEVIYQNEQGNILCVNLPQGYSVVGRYSIIERDLIVFWLLNIPENKSQIGIVYTNQCSYEVKIDDSTNSCLNLSINYPIKKAVHKITACGLEVYWTDNYNPRRFVDLLNLPYAEDISGCNTNASTTIDCNRLNVQPNFSVPNIDYTLIDSEGNTTAGSYQFAIQYANSLGDGYTSYYSVTNPVPINDPFKVTLDFNYQTGKAIKLQISNIDTTGVFDYYNLAVIKTVNAIVSVDLVGTYMVEGPTQQVIYTGQSKAGIKLTVDDIFERFVVFDKANDVTSVQDILVWSELTTQERVSYQKIANQIKLQWESYLVTPTSKQYKDPLISADYRGYMRDEVYPIEMVILYKNGYQTDGFHIPARAAIDTDLAIVDTNDAINQSNTCSDQVVSTKRWKVYNTASISGQLINICIDPTQTNCADSCYVGPYQYGEFSYWESTETYPCNVAVWGDLAGQPIRHHKFPDNLVTNHFDTFGNIFPLGIRIDLDVIWALVVGSNDLTQEQKDNIAGIKIVRGDRANNKSVVAKGILYNVGEYTKDKSTYLYPNYPYNDLRIDPFISETSNSLTFNPLDSTSTETFSLGSVETDLNDEDVVNLNIYHGVDLEYEGIFQGDLGPRRIRVGLSLKNLPSGAHSTGFEVVFDSASFVAGLGASWNLSLTGQYSKTVGGANAIAFQGILNIFGTVNKTIQDSENVLVPQEASIIGTFMLLATGVNDGDVALQSSSTGIADVVRRDTPQLDGFSSPDSKSRFTFHSPDTSFYQPTLGDILKIDEALIGQSRGRYAEVKDHSRYKFPSLGSYLTAIGIGVIVGFASGLYGQSDQPFDGAAMFSSVQFIDDLIYKLIPRRNFAYQYDSIGNYTNFVPVNNDNGNKIRLLDIAAYLIPGVQGVGDAYQINNYQRESSVYLKTSQPLPYVSDDIAVPVDGSRITLGVSGHCGNPMSLILADISAYYGGIKRSNLDQYGQIYSYQTIDTGSQFLRTDTGTKVIFGGDCFINKFAFKRKVPFFLDNRVGQPDDSDIFYDTIGNIGYPTYWFSTDIEKGTGGKFSVGKLFGVKVNNFDCKESKFFYDAGKIYLFVYGIPYFFVESEVNVDYRQAYNSLEGDFFPHMSTDIPDNWVQEITTSINNDNTYIYNKSFSKQNEETFFSHLPIDFVPGQDCTQYYPNKAIYSDIQQDVVNYKKNNWLIYRPASYFDFPLSFGKLISLDGIENSEILARFENKALVYNRLLTMDTSTSKAVYIGNDKLFSSAPPMGFKNADIGFNGTQHKFFVQTEFGDVSLDCKRGNVYLINGNNATDISSMGADKFFSDNLPFQIQKAFPDYDIDNNFKGVGVAGIYEGKYKRLIITKLDYSPIYDNITYNVAIDKFYYGGEEISLYNTQYFCNRSFTVSFSFTTKRWASFHSYIPNYYAQNGNTFFTGRNPEAKVWTHNTTLTTYNNFYGEIAPYVIEYAIPYEIVSDTPMGTRSSPAREDEILQSVKDYSKVLRQIDDVSFVETDVLYFNKCWIYNNQQSTGVLNLVAKLKGNMKQSLQYPKYNTDSKDILFTKSDNFYNFNTINDVVNLQGIPLFTRSCQSLSVDKIVNQSNMIYKNQSYKKPSLRAKESKLRLILDNRSDIRIISQFILEETETSIK